MVVSTHARHIACCISITQIFKNIYFSRFGSINNIQIKWGCGRYGDAPYMPERNWPSMCCFRNCVWGFIVQSGNILITSNISFKHELILSLLLLKKSVKLQAIRKTVILWYRIWYNVVKLDMCRHDGAPLHLVFCGWSYHRVIYCASIAFLPPCFCSVSCQWLLLPCLHVKFRYSLSAVSCVWSPIWNEVSAQRWNNAGLMW